MDKMSKDVLRDIEEHFYASNPNKHRGLKIFMSFYFYLWHTIAYGFFLASWHNMSILSSLSISNKEGEGLGILILFLQSFSIVLRDDQFQWDLINAGRKLIIAIIMFTIFGGGVLGICPICCGAFSCKLLISMAYFLTCWMTIFLILTKLSGNFIINLFNLNDSDNIFELYSDAYWFLIIFMIFGYLFLIRCFYCEYGYFCRSPKFLHVTKWAKKISKNKANKSVLKDDIKKLKERKKQEMELAIKSNINNNNNGNNNNNYDRNQNIGGKDEMMIRAQNHLNKHNQRK